MGSADLVPGVSGGTIALVLGIYDDVVAVVRDGATTLGEALRLDFAGAWRRLRAVDWTFLLPLLAGIASAIAVLAGPLSTLLEEHPVMMSAAFFGLVAGSVVVARAEVADWDIRRLLVAVTVAVATFLLLGLRGGRLEDPALLIVFAGGALASVAMILPGVSGSFLLLMVGLYQFVLEAVEAREVATIVTVALGAVTGLALFSSLLNRLLHDHHDTVMAALIGLLGGSLRVLWPWPAGDGVGDPALAAPRTDDVPLAVGIAVIAAAVVWVAGSAARRIAPEHEPAPS